MSGRLLQRDAKYGSVPGQRHDVNMRPKEECSLRKDDLWVCIAPLDKMLLYPLFNLVVPGRLLERTYRETEEYQGSDDSNRKQAKVLGSVRNGGS
ncbi:hypothetical protein CONPUDRAFT_83229 [Coniophora puteana RWD-64-598 SS2]|uniref:Uncharacterized protein n=1 Tax=Coniophora puteana (strain RWD-64-598) TaxID=741705 RepID=A0A5M3MMR4_CONPW|nr:uncharacterized protein CONPUDRAFT_83229 [Coniophora puteana RWD-64-598 SS2]EIW80064.1 hypothetical protein CONPUDRAFT_83229 [Coniophora puteana RWD-64-598 SS2]